MLKFRLSNHKLPIHSQRFLDIPRGERVCDLCESGDIGDEFHYLFNCKDARIVQERKKALSPYHINRPNAFKYDSLVNIKSKVKLTKIAIFLRFIMNLFK